jgi:hypothetical protein
MAIYVVHFVVIWYIVPSFGILCEEKSGNLGTNPFSDDIPSICQSCMANILTPQPALRFL